MEQNEQQREVPGLSGRPAVESSAKQEVWVRSLSQGDALEEGMATHFSTLAWEIHGQRSLVGYSPRGRKESDSI